MYHGYTRNWPPTILITRWNPSGSTDDPGLNSGRCLNKAASKRNRPYSGLSHAIFLTGSLLLLAAPGRGKVYRFFRTGLCTGLTGRGTGDE